jgi:hypothetical protein
MHHFNLLTTAVDVVVAKARVAADARLRMMAFKSAVPTPVTDRLVTILQQDRIANSLR